MKISLLEHKRSELNKISKCLKQSPPGDPHAKTYQANTCGHQVSKRYKETPAVRNLANGLLQRDRTKRQ